jgi:homoprotocatechuate degradation regulator HpaR
MTMPPTTDLGDTQQSLPMALLRAREAVMARFRPILARHGINEQQWRVIRVLAEADRMDATELAQRANILAPSLTRMIKALTEMGLITMARDTADARRLTLAIAPQGRALIQSVAPESQQVTAEIEAWFGADQLVSLLQLLDQLSQFPPK